jgi:hypothetical protein
MAAPDRMRASDRERESAVVELREAAAEGRLTVEELDERTAAAYAAATRGELDALLDDIPLPELEPAPLAPPKPKRPWFPGRTRFRARWRAPVPRAEAAKDLLEYIMPPLHTYGYELVQQTPEWLVFERRMRPAWTVLIAVIVFPIGLLALLHTERERIAIELIERGQDTSIIATGSAPLRIRRAMLELER